MGEMNESVETNYKIYQFMLKKLNKNMGGSDKKLPNLTVSCISIIIIINYLNFQNFKELYIF